MSIHRTLLGVLVLALAVANPGDASIPDAGKMPHTKPLAPEKGIFLVAKPDMQDPRFQRTVVLLLAHSDKGTLGVIINRPTEILLSRVLPDLQVPAADEHALFFGGPVGMDMLIFLMRSNAPPKHGSHVMTDVYYSADRETLEELLKKQKDKHELRMYLGHSGWAPGQLAAEIARGDWLLARASSVTVFQKDLHTIWPELIEQRPGPGMFIDNRASWSLARATDAVDVSGGRK
jgi:putative transcriptional regulator